jgi:ribosomal protein S18 acetylase RimI-like enzyme
VLPLNPDALAVASDILAVQIAAYRVEGALIGISDFAPLNSTVEEIASSVDVFIGVHLADRLVGVARIESLDGHPAAEIASLVVHPEFHRQGIGRLLLQHVIATRGRDGLRVSTAEHNAPALGLYRQMGFRFEAAWTPPGVSFRVVRLLLDGRQPTPPKP